MAHEIYENNMVYVGEVPWHGLGTEIPGTATGMQVKELLDLSPVETRPVYCLNDKQELVEVPEKFATIRLKDQRPLGVVGTDFTPVQDSELIDTLDKLRAEGLVSFETAGLLRNGSRFWVMMNVPEDKFMLKTPNGKKDEVIKRLLVAHGHDGSLKTMILPTNVRVVCANTLSMALGGNRASRKENQRGSGIVNGYVIKHTRNAEERIKAAVDGYRESIKYFDAVQKQAEKLILTPFSDDNMKKLTTSLFPVAAGKEQDIPAQTLKARYEVERLFVEGAGHQELALTGTAWGAYNAVTEYLDYNRLTRGIDKTDHRAMTERRMTNAWFNGPVMNKKVEALNLIGEIVEAA
jgi:phage/plasmid-like protein (TIGR03299 family)